MLSLYYPEVIAALAGICSGCGVGVIIATKGEMITRGVQTRADPLQRVPAATKLVMVTASKIALLAGLIILVGLGVLRVGGVEHLNGHLKIIFGLSFAAGAGIGKCGRYLYWRAKTRHL